MCLSSRIDVTLLEQLMQVSHFTAVSHTVGGKLDKEAFDLIYPASSKITTFLHETRKDLFSLIPDLQQTCDIQLGIVPAVDVPLRARLLDAEIPVKKEEIEELQRWISEFLELTPEELEDQAAIAEDNKIGLLPHLCGVASLFNQLSKDAQGAPCTHLLYALGFGDLVREKEK
jgi:hypothetical protein